jgi:hypothetical protein
MDSAMRALTAVRAAVALTYLTAPRWLPGLVLGTRLDRRASIVVRVLGMRQLIEASVAAAIPSPLTFKVSSAVDGLHAGSMLALAATDDRRRKVALADAVLAGGLCAATWGQARSLSRTTNSDL